MSQRSSFSGLASLREASHEQHHRQKQREQYAPAGQPLSGWTSSSSSPRPSTAGSVYLAGNKLASARIKSGTLQGALATSTAAGLAVTGKGQMISVEDVRSLRAPLPSPPPPKPYLRHRTYDQTNGHRAHDPVYESPLGLYDGRRGKFAPGGDAPAISPKRLQASQNPSGFFDVTMCRVVPSAVRMSQEPGLKAMLALTSLSPSPSSSLRAPAGPQSPRTIERLSAAMQGRNWEESLRQHHQWPAQSPRGDWRSPMPTEPKWVAEATAVAEQMIREHRMQQYARAGEEPARSASGSAGSYDDARMSTPRSRAAHDAALAAMRSPGRSNNSYPRWGSARRTGSARGGGGSSSSPRPSARNTVTDAARAAAGASPLGAGAYGATFTSMYGPPVDGDGHSAAARREGAQGQEGAETTLRAWSAADQTGEGHNSGESAAAGAAGAEEDVSGPADQQHQEGGGMGIDDDAAAAGAGQYDPPGTPASSHGSDNADEAGAGSDNAE